MKKRVAVVLSLVAIVVIVVSTFVAIGSYQGASKKPFYVGVTYGGSSTTEAEQLIDKVKNYTNLFVVQSSPLQSNLTAMEEVCDYAVNSGLNIITYFSSSSNSNATSFLDTAQTRWGSHFLGVYYSDEPGGRMIDFGMPLYNASSGEWITKRTGFYSVNKNANGQYTAISFYDSGMIDLSVSNSDASQFYHTNYYPDGTVMYYASSGTGYSILYQPNGTVTDQYGNSVTDAGDISQFEPYPKLWDSRPIKTYADAAKLYVDTQQNSLASIRNQSSVKLFTSDYALDWYDYQGGYDVVLGELGWNQSTNQSIALVRGAADMQHKSWGAMITWESQSAPYMQSGDQIYNESRQAYESGATYVVVFNYSPNDNGTGLMQDEHFAALQKFWSDVVQNPQETNNARGQAAFVLPKDYGSGLRRPDDIIWGLWQPDNTSQQVWTALQASLSRYGSNLDIVYDDSTYPVAGAYSQVYYWNQTI